MRTDETLLESAFRHDRVVLLVILVLIPLASWAWIAAMALDMYGVRMHGQKKSQLHVSKY